MASTKIVGIVNLTTDSFSDGGRYDTPAAARKHALELVAAGADLLDLGPASSNPDGESVDGPTEIARLTAALDGLDPSIPVSIDSPLADTQRWALRKGVAMLNDIRGFPDPDIYDELADGLCRLVVMHSVQGSARADRRIAAPDTMVDRIERFFEARLEQLIKAGITHERLILDPGMGFFLGSDPRASFATLAQLPRLRARFGLPLYVSVSRKSFLADPPAQAPLERGHATLAAECRLLADQVDYVRTHDVAALAAARGVWQKLDQWRNCT